ncbi:MAG TPA: ATP-binding protein, partial [Myxococcota bacterium]|nr:ATP-binding protein [Myxococcota bacterium]
GYTADDFLSGKVPYAQIVHPEDVSRVKDEVKRHADSTTPSFVQEYRIVLPDGQTRWIYDRTVVVRDAKGAITHFDGYVLDVTEGKVAEEEHRRLEAQFHHAQKLESLGVLAGGIAHDFNNLLMSMLGHASLAETDVPEGSLAQEHLKQIELAARRASELTNQMLAYSGRGRFVVGPVDLSALVSEMARLLETVISKSANLKVELGAGLPAIEADATQLRQVVMNLITNASDALEDKPGRITLRTGVVSGAGAGHRMVFGESLVGKRCVFLEVSDTGSGMDEATQKRIFDPFFTTKAAGRGLGLAAVLGIVRGHGGAIRVDSTKGRGTTVEVRFPASNAPLPPKSDLSARTTRGRAPGGVVLVVDDEQSVRNVSRAMLERLGYRVVLAENGTEALDNVRTQGKKLTAAVLDLTMPGEKGDLVFASIRKIAPELPILVSSGWHESEAIPRLGASGNCRFLQKPYATRDLGEALDLLLGTREADSS